ncbi:hypothetical protein ADK54_14020 [Streptomyces sp. WM6378]|nr:hypothetical protein ADK54_14020 [Streptomyces sp. WM6378]
MAVAGDEEYETVELTQAELDEVQALSQEIQNDASLTQQAEGRGDMAAAQALNAGAGKKIIKLLQKSPKVFKAAIRYAKAGNKAFNGWMSKQNWAIRAAWWALNGSAQSWVIDYLAHQIS